ncbi:MAG: lysozyme [Richelia sp. RM2_1_2]|nr:lysozyme [Richelia sp. RM2_1_2]
MAEKTDLKMSDRGLELLTAWEGFKTRVYKDSAGLPTIGVGHLLTKSELSSGKVMIKGVSVKVHNGLTHQQVVDLLEQDIVNYETTVNDVVTVKLNQKQFDALTSFCFNVGQRAFANSTLVKRLNAKAYNEVPAQLMRWTRAGGRVIKGLVNRRKNEIALWEGKI